MLHNQEKTSKIKDYLPHNYIQLASEKLDVSSSLINKVALGAPCTTSKAKKTFKVLLEIAEQHQQELREQQERFDNLVLTTKCTNHDD